jgi:hypothetical protein
VKYRQNKNGNEDKRRNNIKNKKLKKGKAGRGKTIKIYNRRKERK